MENCPTYPAESIDSDCNVAPNPTANDDQRCPAKDLNNGEEIHAATVLLPKTKDSEKDENSVVTGLDQMQENDASIAPLPNTNDSEEAESSIVAELNKISQASTARSCVDSVPCVSDSDESSSTDTSDLSDDSLNTEIRRRSVDLHDEVDALKNVNPPKVEGEMLISDLPPVEDLCITLPDHAMMHAFGRVSQIMKDNSVVIQSYEGMPALDHNTVLFFSERKAIGRVEETFGPVPNPYYIVRFNSKEHLITKNVELDREVFYAPNFHDLTTYVFLSTLQKMRGSDASWMNDKEPPPNLIDYSDDEQERKEKKASRSKGKNKTKRDRNGDAASPAVNDPNRGRNFERQNQWRNESHRMNVLPMPNPAFEGWNAAVNMMGSHRMQPAYPYSAPVFGQPTSMNGMPFPPMQAPHPFNNPPPYVNQNYGNVMALDGPGQGWPHYPPPFNCGVEMFPQPPPPPPPPPPAPP